jgi:hypothetical protein
LQLSYCYTENTYYHSIWVLEGNIFGVTGVEAAMAGNLTSVSNNGSAAAIQPAPRRAPVRQAAPAEQTRQLQQQGQAQQLRQREQQDFLTRQDLLAKAASPERETGLGRTIDIEV